MRRIYLQLQILALAVLVSSAVFGQQVFSVENSNQKNPLNTETITLANGDHAFCMVAGGNGSTGWAKFNLEDPIVFEILAPKPSSIYFLGGDIGPDGTWYCTEFSGGFYSVDTTTGVHTLLTTLPSPLSGFTYSPAYETYFGCTGSELFSMNIETYELTSIGMMGNAGSMTGLGADFRGNLYGIDINDDRLYSINPVTAVATALGESGYNFDYNQNCTYDKTKDLMYHAGFWVSPSVFGGLFTYDLVTGAATEIAAFPNSQEVVSFGVPWSMPAHGSISGLVSDAISGDPVENVSVYLEPVNDPLGTDIYKTTTTDGMYNFGVVLPGNYKITAVSGNYGVAIIDEIVVVDGDNLVYDIQLQEAPYTATFNVFTYEGSNPVEGATVNFVNQIVQTNAQGIAIFENIAAGVYNFTADFDGYYQGFGEVEVVNEDVEADAFLYVENNIQKSLVIIEEATGTWCGACPDAAIALDQIVEEDYPVGVIAYHSGDVYETDASGARCGYYGIIAYPTCTFNGTEQFIGASHAGYLAHVEEMMDDMTPIALSFSDVEYSVSANTITGKLDLENFGPVNSNHLRLQIALTESHIPEIWGGLEELNFVEREMFPDEYGTSVEMSTIGTQEVEFELSLDDVLDLGHCKIVAFVQDNFSKEIYNGLNFDCSLITGIDATPQTNNVQLYPNPAQNKVMVNSIDNMDYVQLINLAGQVILEQSVSGSNVELNTTNLEAGLYFVKINSSNITSTQKLIIER